jgi:ribosomal protein S14
MENSVDKFHRRDRETGRQGAVKLLPRMRILKREQSFAVRACPLSRNTGRGKRRCHRHYPQAAIVRIPGSIAKQLSAAILKVAEKVRVFLGGN